MLNNTDENNEEINNEEHYDENNEEISRINNDDNNEEQYVENMERNYLEYYNILRIEQNQEIENYDDSYRNYFYYIENNDSNEENNSNEENEGEGDNILGFLEPILTYSFLGPEFNSVLRGFIIERILLQEDRHHDRTEESKINITSQLYETTNKKYDECSICTENYQDNDEVSVLKCFHIFHYKCIDEWGHYSTTCPICKQEI